LCPNHTPSTNFSRAPTDRCFAFSACLVAPLLNRRFEKFEKCGAPSCGPWATARRAAQATGERPTDVELRASWLRAGGASQALAPPCQWLRLLRVPDGRCRERRQCLCICRVIHGGFGECRQCGTVSAAVFAWRLRRGATATGDVARLAAKRFAAESVTRAAPASTMASVLAADRLLAPNKSFCSQWLSQVPDHFGLCEQLFASPRLWSRLQDIDVSAFEKIQIGHFWAGLIRVFAIASNSSNS